MDLEENIFCDSRVALPPKGMDDRRRSVPFTAEANPELLKQRLNAEQPMYYELASNNMLTTSYAQTSMYSIIPALKIRISGYCSRWH